MQTPAATHPAATGHAGDTPGGAAGHAATQVAKRTDDTIRRSVKALITAKGHDPDAVALGIGMARRTFYRRVSGNGAPFTAGEVQTIADYFDVPVSDLFSGLDLVVVPLRGRRGASGSSEIGAIPAPTSAGTPASSGYERRATLRARRHRGTRTYGNLRVTRIA